MFTSLHGHKEKMYTTLKRDSENSTFQEGGGKSTAGCPSELFAMTESSKKSAIIVLEADNSNNSNNMPALETEHPAQSTIFI